MTTSDIKTLEERSGVTVVHMPGPTSCSHEFTSPFSSDTLTNAVVTMGDVTEEIQAIAPVLNAICSKLWQRDQEIMGSK